MIKVSWFNMKLVLPDTLAEQDRAKRVYFNWTIKQ
jgi:hypothetical protein